VDAPAGSYVMSEVTNLTPFTWTYQGAPWNDPYAVYAPKTLLPGQTASWSTTRVENTIYDFRYEFTDGNGYRHSVGLQDEERDGLRDDFSGTSFDGSGSGAVDRRATEVVSQAV